MKLLNSAVPIALFSISAALSAQQILPPPDPQVTGNIGLTFDTSDSPQYTTPNGEIFNFPPLPQANAFLQPEENPKPNILIILLDDAGFSDSGTFGGAARTPRLDELANNGLRYNRFHTTAVCSSTRAALLTGRNHHSAATGNLTDFSTGYEGYTGIIPQSTATIGEILKGNGYNTAWLGKHHNVPVNQQSVAGPFDRWPTGLGFEYFYGFLGGFTSQWFPNLIEGIRPVDPPKTPAEGYHLTADLADRAIDWIKYQHSVAPQKPFLLYFAPAAVHAPQDTPAEFREKYKGQFDQGWDELRRETFLRQKQLGVIPEDAVLTCYPHSTQKNTNCEPNQNAGVLSTPCFCPNGIIPPWDSLADDNGNMTDSQKVAARFMENYAGFIEHTDYEIGRIFDALKETGQFDNTLIFYIYGDNGGDNAGGRLGTLNWVKNNNAYPETTIDRTLARIDDIGTPRSEASYNAGWGWASNTPFQWYKFVASHFGGTRNGMVISWPAGIKPTQQEEQQGLRSQFHHVIDIVPTILELTGIQAPIEVNGVDQKPIEGISMAYTFNEPTAAERKLTQYFELNGDRAIYNKGWMASVLHQPQSNGSAFSFADEVWELYHIDEDFSQAVNLANDPQYAEQLRNLQNLLWADAGRYSVLPLDDRLIARANTALHPGYTTGRSEFEFFPGAIRLPEIDAPDVRNRSYRITATVDLTSFKKPREVNGVIVSLGGLSGGYSLYFQKGILKYEYNWFDTQRYQIETATPVTVGSKSTIELTFSYTGDTRIENERCLGDGGTVAFIIDGQPTKLANQNNTIGSTVPFFFGSDGFDIGLDLGSRVVKYNRQYKRFANVPFAGLEKVKFELQPLPSMQRGICSEPEFTLEGKVRSKGRNMRPRFRGLQ